MTWGRKGSTFYLNVKSQYKNSFLLLSRNKPGVGTTATRLVKPMLCSVTPMKPNGSFSRLALEIPEAPLQLSPRSLSFRVTDITQLMTDICLLSRLRDPLPKSLPS